MARARAHRLRRRGPGAAARRRNDSLEARLAHPIFAPLRPWLEGGRTLERLNALAEARGLRTESGRPVRFVPPAQVRGGYETGVFETGRVATRPDHPHDWFNALAWLAFPLTKP